jgi:ribosome-associated protein
MPIVRAGNGLIIYIIHNYRLLAQLNVLDSRPKSSVTRLTKNSKIFKTAIQAILEKKGEKVVSLDLRKIPEAVSDFFIICEATTSTQIKGIADNIEYRIKEVCGEVPYKHEGQQALQWVLIDYVNIVVHIMTPDNRNFYALEDMWSDAPSQVHEDK